MHWFQQTRRISSPICSIWIYKLFKIRVEYVLNLFDFFLLIKSSAWEWSLTRFRQSNCFARGFRIIYKIIWGDFFCFFKYPFLRNIFVSYSRLIPIWFLIAFFYFINGLSVSVLFFLSICFVSIETKTMNDLHDYDKDIVIEWVNTMGYFRLEDEKTFHNREKNV